MSDVVELIEQDHREVEHYGGPWTTRREHDLGGDCVPVQHSIGPCLSCSRDCERESGYKSEFHTCVCFMSYCFSWPSLLMADWQDLSLSPVQGVFLRPITPRMLKYSFRGPPFKRCSENQKAAGAGRVACQTSVSKNGPCDEGPYEPFNVFPS